MATIADFLVDNADKIKNGITTNDIIYAQYTYTNVHTPGTFTDLEFVDAPKAYKRLTATGTTYGIDSKGFEFLSTPAHPELYALDANGFRFKFSADANDVSDLVVGTDIKHLFEFNDTDKNGIVIPNDIALISKDPVTDNAITAISDNASNIGTKYLLKANDKYYTVSSGTITEVDAADILTSGFDSTETGFDVSSLGTDVQLVVICSIDTTNVTDFDFTLTYGVTEATVTGGTRSTLSEFVNFYLFNGDTIDIYKMLADHTVQNGVLNSDLYADTDLYAITSDLGKALTNNNKASNLYMKVPTYDDFDGYVPNNEIYTNVYSIISEGTDNPNYATDDKVTGSQDSIKKYQATGTITTGTNFRPMLNIVYKSTLGEAYANPGKAEDFFWINRDVAETVTRSDVTITKNTKYELPMIKLGGVDAGTVAFADRIPATLTNIFNVDSVPEFYFKFWINQENAAAMAIGHTEFRFGDPLASGATITLKIANDGINLTGTNPSFSKTSSEAISAGEFILHVRSKDTSQSTTALVELSCNGTKLIEVTESADSINFTNKFICTAVAYENSSGDTSFSLLSEIMFFESVLTKNNHMLALDKKNVITDPNVTWNTSTVGDKTVYSTNAAGSQYLYHDIDTQNFVDAAADAIQLDIVGMVVSTSGLVDSTDHTQIGAYTTKIRDTNHTKTREFARKTMGEDLGNWTFLEDPITKNTVSKTTIEAVEIGTVTSKE